MKLEKQNKRSGEKRTTKVTYCLITKEWVAKHATNRYERITFIATWSTIAKDTKNCLHQSFQVGCRAQESRYKGVNLTT